MIVADTGAIVALLDRSDEHHAAIKKLFRQAPSDWVLPWAVLPEVDHLLPARAHGAGAHAFMADLATGAFQVEWGTDADLARALELNRQYAALRLGLVDGVVMATAERLEAAAIATFDRRHFGAVALRGRPALVP